MQEADSEDVRPYIYAEMELMYESFYGFEKRAFATVPDTMHFFPVDELMAARETLIQTIENGEGPGVVVGPAGVGKTLLCELLKDRFRTEFQVVTLACGQLREPKEMLQGIVHQLRLPHQGQNEGELRLTLLDYLEPSAECPRGMLLLVDEAQHLSIELLEEVRMISNFVRDGSPRVRVVLLGNERLEENLTNPKLESLNQRLAARCYLEGLTRDETRQYVTGLTNAAGGALGMWNEDAMRSIYDATHGVPRVINQLCNRTLSLGAAQQSMQIDGRIVQRAWSELQQLPTPWSEELEETPSECVIEFGGLDDDLDRTSQEASDAAPANAVEVPSMSDGCDVSYQQAALPGAKDSVVADVDSDIDSSKYIDSSECIDSSEYCTMDMETPVPNWENFVSNAASPATGGQEIVQYELSPEAYERVTAVEERLAEIEDVCGTPEPPLAVSGEMIENPFGDFPEEEAVLADHIPLGDPARTMGPLVMGESSRWLARSLELTVDTPHIAAIQHETEYSQREIAIDTDAEREQDHEPATVVPIFAATRDDRDIIVIEDDHPKTMQNRQIIHQLRGHNSK